MKKDFGRNVDRLGKREGRISVDFHLTDCRRWHTTCHLSVKQRAPRGGAVNRVRPEMWSSPKRGTLVRSPLFGRLSFCARCGISAVPFATAQTFGEWPDRMGFLLNPVSWKVRHHERIGAISVYGRRTTLPSPVLWRSGRPGPDFAGAVQCHSAESRRACLFVHWSPRGGQDFQRQDLCQVSELRARTHPGSLQCV